MSLWRKRKDDEKMNMREYTDKIPDYLAWLKEYKSAGTLRTYDTVLTQFADIVKALPRDVSPEEAVVSYIRIKRDKGMNVSTANYRRAVLRSFFNFMGRPLDTRIVPKIPSRSDGVQEKHVSYDELKKILNILDKIEDKFIVTMFLVTGARISEICLMRYKDFTIEQDSTITVNIVTLKGRGMPRERILNIIPQWAIEIISTVLKSVPSMEEKIWKGSPDNLRWKIYSLAKKAELKGVKPHSFRHALASYLMNVKNVPVGVVKDILGHENLQTTSIYSHTEQKQIKDGMSKLD